MVRRAAVSARYGRGSVGSAGNEVECDPWPVAGPGSGVGSSESALGQVSSSGRWRVQLQSLDYPNQCLCQEPFPAGENPVAVSGTSESALGRRPLWKVVDPVFGIWAVRVGTQDEPGLTVGGARELHVPGAQVPKPPRRTARAATRTVLIQGECY